MDTREMYAEVNALLGAIGKALDMDAESVAKAIEAGQVLMEMQTDERGENFVAVAFRGKWARVYQGAIQHAPEKAEAEEEDTGGCGGGSCGCGGR